MIRVVDQRNPSTPAIRPRSLRSQIVLWNTLILVVLLALLGIVIHFSVQMLLIRSVDRELEMRTRRMANEPPPEERWNGPRGMAGPGPFGGGPMPPPPPPPAGFPPPEGGGPPSEHGPGEYGAPGAGAFRPRRIDRTGQVVAPAEEGAAWDTAAAEAALRHAIVYSTIDHQGTPVRVISRVYPARGPIEGVVQAPYPLTEVNHAVATVDRTLLLLLPAALILAALGAALLTARALTPVRSITRAAERIGARDLSARLPETGHDELSELAGTFNGMLARLEDSFREQQYLVHRLQALVDQQRRFTADASHELRTPLTAIRANTSLCLSTETTPEAYRESMEEIDRAAAGMSRLVNDLLLLARADAGRLAQRRIVLPVREAVDQAIAGMPRRAQSARIDVDIDDHALCIEADEAEIVRVLTNLLENAARHTPPDGRITVAATPEGRDVRVTVTDTGAGVAPEHLAHLGQRFFRADASRARSEGGTGLGLSICKSIVEAHGGTIRFESAPGRGLTVTLRLPAGDR